MKTLCNGNWGTNQMNGAPVAHPPVSRAQVAQENGITIYVCPVCNSYSEEWEVDVAD